MKIEFIDEPFRYEPKHLTDTGRKAILEASEERVLRLAGMKSVVNDRCRACNLHQAIELNGYCPGCKTAKEQEAKPAPRDTPLNWHLLTFIIIGSLLVAGFGSFCTSERHAGKTVTVSNKR